MDNDWQGVQAENIIWLRLGFINCFVKMKKEQNSSEQKIDQGDVMPLASHEELLDIDRSSDEKKKNQSNTNDSAPRIS